MSDIKDGGPVFPQQRTSRNAIGDSFNYSDGGMTLRDYFAAAALPSMWELIFKEIDAGTLSKEHAEDPRRHAAVMSYEMANAMLKERAK